MTFPFCIEKEQDIKMRMPSLELTQPWKIHTTLYQPDYLMNNKTYQDLINYLTTLTYPTDYDDKRKTHLRKNSTQYFVKNHTLYRRNKKGNLRVIVQDHVEPILFHIHRDITGAHLGINAHREIYYSENLRSSADPISAQIC